MSENRKTNMPIDLYLLPDERLFLTKNLIYARNASKLRLNEKILT